MNNLAIKIFYALTIISMATSAIAQNSMTYENTELPFRVDKFEGSIKLTLPYEAKSVCKVKAEGANINLEEENYFIQISKSLFGKRKLSVTYKKNNIPPFQFLYDISDDGSKIKFTEIQDERGRIIKFKESELEKKTQWWFKLITDKFESTIGPTFIQDQEFYEQDIKLCFGLDLIQKERKSLFKIFGTTNFENRKALVIGGESYEICEGDPVIKIVQKGWSLIDLKTGLLIKKISRGEIYGTRFLETTDCVITNEIYNQDTTKKTKDLEHQQRPVEQTNIETDSSNFSSITSTLPQNESNKNFKAEANDRAINNPNRLPFCPKPDFSKNTDLERLSKWDSCWGVYTIETHSTFKGDVIEGEFHNGKLNGYGIYIYLNGDKYIGDFKNQKMDGIGTLWFNGNKFIGQFSNDKIYSHGTYTYYDGKVLNVGNPVGNTIPKSILISQNSGKKD